MFQNVTTVARKTGISEETILNYVKHGWLSAVTKENIVFLSFHQEYRLRFIQHLRLTMGLDDIQVSTVLRFETAPYSLARVPALLAEHCQ
jgi:DNA-binding transcriptional MerR regulator